MSESDQADDSDLLNRPDWKRFHQELRAALLVKVPMELGDESAFGSATTAGRLHQLESQLLYELDEAGKLRPSFSIDQRYPSRYRAAAQIFESTGDMSVVLDGLAGQASSRRMLNRIVRPTGIYLLSLLAIGMLGLAFFAYIAVPIIEDMRNDLVLIPAAEAPERMNWADWLQPVAIAIPVLLAVTLLWIHWRGGLWTLTSWLGGNHFQGDQNTASALQAGLSLMDTGMTAEPAVSLGCDLVGASPVSRGRIIEAVRGHMIPREYATDASRGYVETLVRRFRVLANERLRFVRVVVPNLFVLGIGGVGVFAYCLALFWPLITLLFDLSLPLK